MLQEEVGLQEI
jgi:hypothetical protein